MSQPAKSGRTSLESITLREYAKRKDPPPPGGSLSLVARADKKGWYKCGVVADTHLGSKHYRHDVIYDLYKLFKEEGVRDVFHCGNYIEGECRFNRFDIDIHGMSEQLRFFAREYPEVKGLTTYFVAGDDHEGWYQQREGINIGEMTQATAQRMGRKDLIYLAYQEADIALWRQGASKPCVLRVMHGGGGTAYALSYKPQKIVESLQGGEKPDILLVGHYHKQIYTMIRNIHTVLPGTGQDQSLFMRKKSIEAHVGGALLYVKLDPKDGHVVDFWPRFRSYFDRKYYERRYEV